jgi:hypothetical protein
MGALLVLWLRPVPAEMEPFFTGPNTAMMRRFICRWSVMPAGRPRRTADEEERLGFARWFDIHSDRKQREKALTENRSSNDRWNIRTMSGSRRERVHVRFFLYGPAASRHVPLQNRGARAGRRLMRLLFRQQETQTCGFDSLGYKRNRQIQAAGDGLHGSALFTGGE